MFVEQLSVTCRYHVFSIPVSATPVWVDAMAEQDEVRVYEARIDPYEVTGHEVVEQSKAVAFFNGQWFNGAARRSTLKTTMFLRRRVSMSSMSGLGRSGPFATRRVAMEPVHLVPLGVVDDGISDSDLLIACIELEKKKKIERRPHRRWPLQQQTWRWQRGILWPPLRFPFLLQEHKGWSPKKLSSLRKHKVKFLQQNKLTALT